jgi:2-dehydro-3-deoxyglucarate aldolase
METGFRARLRRGEKLLGTMVTLNTPASAEILADAGFDWLFIDGEHGPYETGDIQAILQAVGQRAACVVRVAVADETPIKRVLDLGADGIIAPQVNTAEHAKRIVAFSRYAPEGSRGVGLGRAHGYGMRFTEYLEEANDRIAVIVQAEHARAVENIESIAAVEGIDAVLIGPYDLAASLGRMGQVEHPDVVGAIDHVTEVCLKAGVRLGYFGVTAEAVQPYIARGYTLIIAGVDTLFLGGGAKRVLSALR